KGVCFDSGGISIKPSDRMEEMKMDKAGACTVIAAIETVARLAPGTPLLAVAPAVENLPGPHSTRPGDIVTALNGQQVDITNTAGAPEGGLVKSALFLREFVTRPWVHLAIAGTGYYRKAQPFGARGATGVSHATLVELALAGANSH